MTRPDVLQPSAEQARRDEVTNRPRDWRQPELGSCARGGSGRTNDARRSCAAHRPRPRSLSASPLVNRAHRSPTEPSSSPACSMCVIGDVTHTFDLVPIQRLPTGSLCAHSMRSVGASCLTRSARSRRIAFHNQSRSDSVRYPALRRPRSHATQGCEPPTCVTSWGLAVVAVDVVERSAGEERFDPFDECDAIDLELVQAVALEDAVPVTGCRVAVQLHAGRLDRRLVGVDVLQRRAGEAERLQRPCRVGAVRGTAGRGREKSVWALAVSTA